MKGDFSRQTFDPTRHYAGVRMQQGRVQLDADWNEQADLARHRDETATLDAFGRCGGPLHHSAFGVIPTGPLTPAEKAEIAARFPGWTAGAADPVLSAGRYWVNGILVENEATVPYTRQPDLPGTAPLADGSWLLYLDVWERHLTALEEPALREVALGGPDTATRTRVVWQVRALGVPAAVDCDTAVPDYDAATAASTGRMRARARRENAQVDPCVLPAAAGYTGLENQLYRVEIHDGGPAQPFPGLGGWAVATFDAPKRTMVLGSTPGGLGVGDAVELFLPSSADPTAGTVAWVQSVAGKTVVLNGAFTAPDLAQNPRLRKLGATFKWSRDNGIAVSRVLSANQELVVVETLGPDDVLGFHAGEWVELFDDAHELHARPGQMLQVKARNDASRTLVLNAPVTVGPGGIDLAANPRIRRWDGVGAVRGDADYPAEAFTTLEDGVEVRFEEGSYATGDWWLIPARTATAEAQSGGVEWPVDEGGVPLARGPEGIAHAYCRLAVVTVAGGAITAVQDCRCFFAPLTQVNSLSYVSGAGQEALPNPVAAGEKVALGQPLVVGIPNGHCHPGEAAVRFTVRSGTGDLSPDGVGFGGQATLDVPVGSDGLARCWWRLSGDYDPSDAKTLQQLAEARLLQDGVPVQLPILFNASLSVARQVAYEPGACTGMAGQNTVQKAIERLAGFVHLHAAGGVSQEVMPGESLDRVLSVRLASDCGPVQGSGLVRFEVTKGTGTFNGAAGVTVETTAAGVAEVTWTLDTKTHFQEVRAFVLDAAGTISDPREVFFTATLSTADRVSYATGGCATLAGQNTVQKAIDRLAGLLRMEAAGPTSRVLFPGQAWTGLAVRVASDCGAFDSAQSVVRFETDAGNGTFANGQPFIEVPTDASGLATADWTPHPTAPRQGVRARFVASPERPAGAPAEVTFALWLADAPNVAYTPGPGCGELAAVQADTVQKAIDYLCSHVGVCCEVTLAPNDPDLLDKVAAYEQFTDDLDICFRPGEYALPGPVVIKNKRSVRVTGRGAGSRVSCASAEQVFVFLNCGTVVVRDLDVAAGVSLEGKLGPRQNGALTFVDCSEVTVEGCRLRCAGAPHRAATCITAAAFGERPYDDPTPLQVTVRGCEALVGHRQNGFLFLNVDRVLVESNVLRVDGVASALNVDPLLVTPSYGRMVANYLATPEGKQVYSLPDDRPVDLRLWAVLPLVRLRYMPRMPRSLVYTPSLPVRPPRIEVQLGAGPSLGQPVRLTRRAAAAATPAAETAAGETPAEGANPSDPRYRALVEVLEVVGSDAIVVAGVHAGDVQVRGNTVYGFRRGVHIGLSRRGRGGRTQVAAATVADNTIALKQPAMYSRAGHGIFLGNSLSARIEGNRISSWSLPGFTRDFFEPRSEGIRVYGHIGALLLVRDNHVLECDVGIDITAHNWRTRRGLWRVATNVLEAVEDAIRIDPHASDWVRVEGNENA